MIPAREQNRRIRQAIAVIERAGCNVRSVATLSDGTVRIETGDAPPPPAYVTFCRPEPIKRVVRTAPNRNTAERRAYRQQWFRKRAATDPLFVLNRRMAKAIRKALGESKAGRSWESLVGYTLNDLRKRLQAHFVDGMTWENIGAWHIDHIRPLSSFSAEQFNEAWALDNLQPLWGVDNLRKGSRW